MLAVKRHVTFSRYRLRFLCAFQTAGKVSVQHEVNIIWEISRWKLEYNSPVFHPLYAMLHCKRNLSFKPRDVKRPWQSIVDVPWVRTVVMSDFISFHFISFHFISLFHFSSCAIVANIHAICLKLVDTFILFMHKACTNSYRKIWPNIFSSYTYHLTQNIVCACAYIYVRRLLTCELFKCLYIGNSRYLNGMSFLFYLFFFLTRKKRIR